MSPGRPDTGATPNEFEPELRVEALALEAVGGCPVVVAPATAVVWASVADTPPRLTIMAWISAKDSPDVGGCSDTAALTSG
jgi:hypothetical protein